MWRSLGVGLGVVCADVVESLNEILQRAYNDHNAHGAGNAGCNGSTMGGGGDLVGLGVQVFKF